jgi:hypothetical protein
MNGIEEIMRKAPCNVWKIRTKVREDTIQKYHFRYSYTIGLIARSCSVFEGLASFL